jgi:cytochrome c oxidase assembly protein subunit 15
MSLEEFKIIYWWEYTHRLLGRIVGVFYIIPLLFFTLKKLIKGKLLISSYLIFFLICLQGFIGWYMVKSGLTERTDVSHYLLSIHLTLAFIIFILLFWNYLKYKNQQDFVYYKKIPSYLPIFFILCIIIQISVGAFVSGLDAGQIYRTWPLMNNSYFPDDSNLKDLFSIEAFETPSIVQFIHRNIAYFIVLLFGFISTIIYKSEDYIYLRSITLLIFIFLFLQTFLGILTVLFGAQIIVASMHQIGSILLIVASLILVFKNSRIN